MTLRAYTVHGTNIKDATGKKIGHGQTAMLDAALARHYMKNDLLRPFVLEDDANEPLVTPYVEPTAPAPAPAVARTIRRPGTND